MPLNINEQSLDKIPHSLLVKLQAVYDSLKTAERKAADFLLKNPVVFSEASIVEAAEAAGCSEATLVRIAKRLGYAGYPELKAALYAERDENPTNLYKGITEDDDYVSVMKKVFMASKQALDDTLHIMDTDEYKKAVDALCQAERIMFCGAGDAANVARSGYQKFVRIGFNALESPDPDAQLILISHLKPGDVVIAISHTGRTKTILETVKYARSRGITVIAITNFPVSPLSKNADIILLTAAFSEHMKGEVMSKRVAELCIIESLFINVLLRKKDTLSIKLAQSNEAANINKL